MIANDAWVEWHKLGYIKQMQEHAKGKPLLYLWSQCATEETLSKNLYICMDHQWYHRKSSPPYVVQHRSLIMLFVCHNMIKFRGISS